jgi:hypothetical protein
MRFLPGQKVVAIDSHHAHIPVGSVGAIEEIAVYQHSDGRLVGYSVHFESASGLNGKKQPASVFMRQEWLESYQEQPLVTENG